jgi:putative oxidoreductase
MAAGNNDSLFLSLALLVNRLTFGGVVVAQAIAYMRAAQNNMYGHQVFYRDVYKPLDPGYLPEKVSMYYAYGLPYAALLLGVFVLVGIFTRLASGVLLVLLLTVIFAVLKDQGLPTHASNPTVYLVVIAGLALLLSATGAGRFSLDGMTGGGGKKAAAKAEKKD